MIKCDKCGSLLTLFRVYKNRAFCEKCKAWIGWVIYSERVEDIKYCVECNINHAKHSK
ncbi:hypothetical protein HYU16_04790 [Candidatus Woesearchaeota archaeon]|nr:hypothetical protein [Candidatus Woesearchaeota archaeon]